MKKERLEQLRKEIEEIQITYDYEKVYCNLISATIDYQNETQDWSFESLFEDYIDNEILQYLVEYNLKEFGVWAVRNLLDDINYDDDGVYKVDAYGYGHNITKEDLEDIKQDILDTIDELEKEYE